jgi:hypothetical protein
VDVIQLGRVVWSYAEDGPSIIVSWLNEIEATHSDRGQLNAFVELYETAGRRAINQYVVDIGFGSNFLRGTIERPGDYVSCRSCSEEQDFETLLSEGSRDGKPREAFG